MKRLFLSYSSKDLDEVELLDLELRRRGVPLWRDRPSLRRGRVTEVDIEHAAREAAGFLFYLTENAASSEWVREKELAYALRAARRRGAPVVPVFRDDWRAVAAELQRHGGGAKTEALGLRNFSGYVVDRGKVAAQRLMEELGRAADAALGALVDDVAAKLPAGAAVSIGLTTRQAHRPAALAHHFLIDASEDYPNPEGSLPRAEALLPPLRSLRLALTRAIPALRVELVPQCHLTLALAAGFELRRNVGVDLDVVEVHSGDSWVGPARPSEPLGAAWKRKKVDLGGSEDGVAVAVNVSQPGDSFREGVEGFLRRGGPSVRTLLAFEPAAGPSNRSLAGCARDIPHRMVVELVRQLGENPAFRASRLVHLFYAGPPALAVLLAQQLSNTRPFQTYEWIDRRQSYEACFLLASS